MMYPRHDTLELEGVKTELRVVKWEKALYFFLLFKGNINTQRIKIIRN